MNVVIFETHMIIYVLCYTQCFQVGREIVRSLVCLLFYPLLGSKYSGFALPVSIALFFWIPEIC